MKEITNGKYWYDTSAGKLIVIDGHITGSDGEPCPPMDCIMVEVEIINDYS